MTYLFEGGRDRSNRAAGLFSVGNPSSLVPLRLADSFDRLFSLIPASIAFSVMY